MSEFTIRFPNEQKKRFVQPISAGALLAYMPNIDKTVYGMKVNNELVALSKTIDIRASVEPVLKGTQEGSKNLSQNPVFAACSRLTSTLPRAKAAGRPQPWL
nr:hypothetical protein [Treponema phagedenis]